MRRFPLGLTATDLRSFDSTMLKISTASKAAIVAEGVPLRAELSDVEAGNLEKALASDPGDSVYATLNVIARAFDYDVEHMSGGNFLLRKHYSDPTDLPDVTYDEVVRSLGSLLQLIDVYATTPAITSSDPSALRLFDSLTSEQQATTHSQGGLTLTFKDLDSTQKSLALGAAQHTVLDSRTDAIRQALQHLIALHGKNVKFLWTARTDQIAYVTHNERTVRPMANGISANQPIFEYTMPSGEPDHPFQYPLNHGLRILLSGGGMQLAPSLLEKVAPDPFVRRSNAQSESTLNRSDYDPTVPTPQDRLLAPGMMSSRLGSTVTLEALAELLSSSKTGRGVSTGLHITLDPALNGKPVTIYGGHLVSGDQLIRLVSRVYGLQISTEDNKTIFVTTPKVRQFHSVSDLQVEIKRVIPPSLLRAMESQIDRIAALTPDTPGMPDQSPLEERQKFAAMLMMQKRFMVAQTATNSWYYPADRRLLVLATAAVPTPKYPPVLVASLGPEPSRLIALMSLTDGGMVAMRKLLNFKPPLCLTDPTTMRIVLTCSEHNLMQSITIRFNSVDGSGSDTHEGLSSYGRHKPDIPATP